MLNDWLARWSDHMPPQAVSELRAALDPVQPAPPASGGSEASLSADVRLAASSIYGAALWPHKSGAMTEAHARRVRYGLGNESAAINRRWKPSDLIGVLPWRITAAHVGHTVGVFLAVETKKPGWRLTPGDKRGQAQAAFISSVRMLGGAAGFASSVEDLSVVCHCPHASRH